jgi:hypothetical protein
VTHGPLDIQRATALLEEVRQDLYDWDLLDIANLLSLWGISAEKILSTHEGWTVTLRYHPDHPDIYMTLPTSQEVHPEVALHAVQIIDNLRGRLGLL